MAASFAFDSSSTINDSCHLAPAGSLNPERASRNEARSSVAGPDTQGVICPTTTAMIGVLCGIAFTVGLIAAGWPPALSLPEFVAMMCAGLFSVAGSCVGMALERLATPRQP